MRRSLAWTLGVVGTAVMAGVAWTQTRPQAPIDPSAPPVPSTVILAPDQADAVAVRQARADPLAVRLRDMLAKSPARAALPQIQASTVPVLGPANPALLATARYYPGEDQYTLVVRDGGTIIEIFGTRRALRSPTGAPLPPAMTAPARPTATRAPPPRDAALARAAQAGLSQIRAERTEYGVDVSFSRFGAAYNVSFICEAPGAADCSEANAIAFAGSMVLLGGGQ